MFELIMAILIANLFKFKFSSIQSLKGMGVATLFFWILFKISPFFIFPSLFLGTTFISLKKISRPGIDPSNKSNPYNLPKSEVGRKAIVSKFNKKYHLALSEQDMNSMVSASYISLEWASEIYSMTIDYNSHYEWLGQGNSWLRIYLYVFKEQQISSVFSKQEEIVFQSFDTIFSEMCTDDKLPTEVIIQNINNRFLTIFDETTFAFAMNYMESKGKRYKYGSPVLTRMHSDIDDLAHKYSSPS